MYVGQTARDAAARIDIDGIKTLVGRAAAGATGRTMCRTGREAGRTTVLARRLQTVSAGIVVPAGHRRRGLARRSGYKQADCGRLRGINHAGGARRPGNGGPNTVLGRRPLTSKPSPPSPDGPREGSTQQDCARIDAGCPGSLMRWPVSTSLPSTTSSTDISESRKLPTYR